MSWLNRWAILCHAAPIQTGYIRDYWSEMMFSNSRRSMPCLHHFPRRRSVRKSFRAPLWVVVWKCKKKAVNTREACEYSLFSLLLAAKDVLPGETSASVTEIPYWWRKICLESGQEPLLVDVVVILFYLFLRITDKRPRTTKVKCKRDESITKQSIFLEYN